MCISGGVLESAVPLGLAAVMRAPLRRGAPQRARLHGHPRVGRQPPCPPSSSRGLSSMTPRRGPRVHVLASVFRFDHLARASPAPVSYHSICGSRDALSDLLAASVCSVRRHCSGTSAPLAHQLPVYQPQLPVHYKLPDTSHSCSASACSAVVCRIAASSRAPDRVGFCSRRVCTWQPPRSEPESLLLLSKA